METTTLDMKRFLGLAQQLQVQAYGVVGIEINTRAFRNEFTGRLCNDIDLYVSDREGLRNFTISTLNSYEENEEEFNLFCSYVKWLIAETTRKAG